MMQDVLDRSAVISAFDVSRETLARLDAILAVLDDWRGRVNLIGPREWPMIWHRHVADSLQLMAHIEGARRVVDLGSGAGFPGLILAAALPEGAHVTLIESVGKKCAFLRAAIEAAELPAKVCQARIESVQLEGIEAVTARALAPLPKLLELSAKWLESGAIGVFPKGENLEEELTVAKQRWTLATEVTPSRTSPTGRVLVVSEAKRRDV
ncbi:MAG: 16S rRNA (guanine(527)-N(7))-methyltransferase RsmG [Hyphomonadaceae bacterium]|nr:16S rRNA (guanine(527)-N(7))-methyltransferase RsmG [Hyphomonadaceae bacterium]